jgi:hypothetical protein
MIEQNKVTKSLDRKLLIMGFEVVDLLAIFLLLSVLNFVFGNSSYQLFLVWLPPITLALILKIAKKNKPDNFLVHFIRYWASPGILKAFPQNHKVLGYK